MRRLGFGLVVLLSGCVRHVRPENTTLPTGLAWCANASRVLPRVSSSAARTSGDYVLAMQPCMRILQQLDLDEAGLVLKVNTNDFGALTGICLEAISFDEPPLLECVARQVWMSSVKLTPRLEAEPYTISLFLD